MNINELWVGDKIRVIATNQIGSFEGIKQGKACIKLESGVQYFLANEIAEYQETEQAHKLELRPQTQYQDLISDKLSFKDTLDLHIEKLNPHYKNRSAGEILSFQLEQCEQFLEKALQLRQGRITIIHGRGKGVLKQAIEQMLHSHGRVSIVYETNNGGALEVWLK